MQAEYLSSADTAKLVRSALKRAFPGVKFSVRASRGVSLNVSWTDGPTPGVVEAVTDQYRGGGFDASIDLRYCFYSWLRPDGSASVASSEGTAGSKGYVEPTREWMPEPGCKLVRFGCDFIFARRNMTEAFAERVIAAARRKYGIEGRIHVSTYDGFASVHASDWNDERRLNEVASRLVILRGA